MVERAGARIAQSLLLYRFGVGGGGFYWPNGRAPNGLLQRSPLELL